MAIICSSLTDQGCGITLRSRSKCQLLETLYVLLNYKMNKLILTCVLFISQLNFALADDAELGSSYKIGVVLGLIAAHSRNVIR